MSGQRARELTRIVINGVSLMAELEEYSPPEIEKEMEEARGGRFVPEEIMVGLKLMTATFKIAGASREVVNAFGIKQGNRVEVDVYEAQRDKDGGVFAVHDELSGEITKVGRDTVKMKDRPITEFSVSLTAYKSTENNRTLYDINTKTQVVNLGQGDIMQQARRAIGIA